ncbi:site-specific integrase [Asanoa sp. WMMD1127]|uniref:tyrosine-type recombinase/integrase n=1 Tax=Asanoa sp. WMMD1127 TaxID=3016107 RepID=UPI0024180474|nr:site-specific integrase [Asanoa sp. WMMD1127]MDG4826036.1 site-specific integrase [Asanoa sp. WMMD1127]
MARKQTPNLSIAAAEYRDIREASGNGSQQSRYSHRSILERFVRFSRDCHVGSLEPAHLERFFYGKGGLSGGKYGKPVAKTTLANYRSTLKGFLDFCHRRGWTPHTGDFLLAGIREKRMTPNRDRFRLNRPQILDLMEAATDPRDRALVAFTANTACRISEAVGMTIGDLRLDREEMYLTRFKTERVQTFPITSDLDAELRVWLTHYAASVDGPLEKGYRLFPARHKARFRGPRDPFQPEGYRPDARITAAREIIQPLAERAGIELEPGDGWHTLRRSAARLFFNDCLEDGWDAALRMTQAFLDHASVKTTELYLGLDHERRNVDAALRGKPFISRGQASGNVVPIDRWKVA